MNPSPGRRDWAYEPYTRPQSVINCPHGYDECWQGCSYPGRCGRFRAAPVVQAVPGPSRLRDTLHAAVVFALYVAALCLCDYIERSL